jgi:hypothetical protein
VPPRCPLAACLREMSEVRTGKRRRSGGDDKPGVAQGKKNVETFNILAQIAHYYPVNNRIFVFLVVIKH